MKTVRITKVNFGWIAEVVIEGQVVRRYECATLAEAERVE